MRHRKSIFLIFIIVFYLSEIRSYSIQKCCNMKKQLTLSFDKCIDFEENGGGNFFEKYEIVNNKKNFVNNSGADFNVVKLGDKDRHIWWIPADIQFLSWKKSALSNSIFAPIHMKDMIDTEFVYGKQLKCDKSYREIVPFADNVYIIDNGSLLLAHIDDNVRPDLLIFPPDAYCIDRVSLLDSSSTKSSNTKFSRDHAFVILLCPCLHMPCIRMCCHPKHSLVNNQNTYSCEHLPLLPKRWDLGYIDYSGNSINNGRRFSLIHATQECKYGYYLLNKQNSSRIKHFWILPDGSVRIENGRSDITTDNYCLNYDSDKQIFHDNLVMCKRISDAGSKLKFRDLLYGSYFIIGASFLALTLIIYSIVPELRKSLHSKYLISHTISLFVSYSILAVTQFFSYWLPRSICILHAYIIQFSFIAAFFWLNVMCIDIAWTFSGYRPASSGMNNDADRSIFILYSIYAWGTTLGISIMTSLADYSDLLNVKYRPRFGMRTCWFQDSTSLGLYFYLPIGLILFINLLLFSYTATRILSMHRDCSEVTRGDSDRHIGSRQKTSKDKNRLMLYVKLFSLMGVTWIFEILSWAIGGPEYYWYLTDAINSLRGVFVFFIFCWKPKILYYVIIQLPTSMRKKCLNYFNFQRFANSAENSHEKQCSFSTQRTDSIPMGKLQPCDSATNVLHT